MVAICVSFHKLQLTILTENSVLSYLPALHIYIIGITGISSSEYASSSILSLAIFLLPLFPSAPWIAYRILFCVWGAMCVFKKNVEGKLICCAFRPQFCQALNASIYVPLILLRHKHMLKYFVESWCSFWKWLNMC